MVSCNVNERISQYDFFLVHFKEVDSRTVACEYLITQE